MKSLKRRIKRLLGKKINSAMQVTGKLQDVSYMQAEKMAINEYNKLEADYFKSLQGGQIRTETSNRGRSHVGLPNQLPKKKNYL